MSSFYPEHRVHSVPETVDACVIGAGIGGVMAQLLAEMGLSVVVLELGPH